jgi:hypothetical protein
MSAAQLRAVGPVSQAFVDSKAPISVMMGPEGSGKTTSGILKGVKLATDWPRTAPDVTRVKFAMIRRLQKDLEKTTMESWLRWFPKSAGDWRGGKGAPATHDIYLPHPKGGIIEMRVEFIATGDLRVEEAMRGWEGSFVYVDEVDLAPANVLRWVRGRCGRYPSETLDQNPKMAWGTCNAPEDGSWVIEDFIDEPKPGHQLFVQPSGLSPRAENIKALGRGWYPEQALTMTDYERKRRIENIPGLSQGAEAVFPEFNPEIHIAAAELRVIPGGRVVVGLDAGGSPAATFKQRAPNGQWRFLDEITTHARQYNSITGPTRMGEAIAARLAERFRGCPVEGIADPSAAYGADTVNGESTWIEIVAQNAGIPVRAAPTNDLTIRREAFRAPMTRMIDGRAPGLLLCPVHCKLMARALARDFQWQVQAGRRTGGVVKNWASHLVEAGEYGLLDGGHYHEVMGRQSMTAKRFAPAIASSDFNPFA